MYMYMYNVHTCTVDIEPLLRGGYFSPTHGTQNIHTLSQQVNPPSFHFKYMYMYNSSLIKKI